MSKSIRTFKCGCVIIRTTANRTFVKETRYAPAIIIPVSVWKLLRRCNSHKINFAKKTDKMIRRSERKRGKGYTKKGHRDG